MTEIFFKGKEFVYNHHLAVPYRSLESVKNKGIGKPSLDKNLIIHGDNLHALKSLLLLYAGKVDCIFIDPPYNTGNEKWCYNDNVNSPMINEWFSSNPVGVEDGLRHDKWCSMMWPRLRLLHELLCDNGVVFACIDDNEQHRFRMMMDEIFGKENLVANFIWHHRKSSQNDIDVSLSHNYITCYARNRKAFSLNTIGIDETKFSNPDNDPRGEWVADPMDAPNVRENLTYEIVNPNTRKSHLPPTGRCWRFSKEKFNEALKDNRIIFGKTGKSKPQYKRFLIEGRKRGKNLFTIWSDVGTATDATKDLKKIFPSNKQFPTPKPVNLLERIIEVATHENSIILDSFAGTGTTAHAVLKVNKRDGGERKFILVEMEGYADNTTAERIRKAINGYSFSGAQKTELFRERLTWTKIKKATLPGFVEKIGKLHAHKYDRIDKTIKNGELIVTGIKDIKERVGGLGGGFTYCTLSDPIEFDKMLSGKHLPSYESLGRTLFHMATLCVLDSKTIKEENFYLGIANGTHVWMKYKPDIDWLKSSEAALTLDWAKQLAKKYKNKNHLVFAPACYVSRKLLNENKTSVEFVPLPYTLYDPGEIQATRN